MISSLPLNPSHDCSLCPRLREFILEWRQREPDWFNGPVPVFLPASGISKIELLIIGLAPGLRGANRTGRPFTGDYAGVLLYDTLLRFGFAQGQFDARPDDGLELHNAAIINAVRCVPPQNKPTTVEIRTCRENFLAPVLKSATNLRAVVTLGRIAHDSTLRTLGYPLRAAPFRHGGETDLDHLRLFSSYHCSRYNTNTGVLTEEMFRNVFARVRDFLDKPAQ